MHEGEVLSRKQYLRKEEEKLITELQAQLDKTFATIRADTAFVMTTLLRGVIQRGTGAAAASLDWPLAGKTGTVDNYTDAWFIGFDPNITVGVWVGYDEKPPT